MSPLSCVQDQIPVSSVTVFRHLLNPRLSSFHRQFENRSPIRESPSHTRLKVWIILTVEDPYDLKANKLLRRKLKIEQHEPGNKLEASSCTPEWNSSHPGPPRELMQGGTRLLCHPVDRQRLLSKWRIWGPTQPLLSFHKCFISFPDNICKAVTNIIS